MTYERYPLGLLDQARVDFALDLMIDADRRAEELEAALSPRPRKSTKSKQGEWEGKAFSKDEINKAAGIYVKNLDLTPWEVWVRYERVRDLEDSGRLGRRKVEDLVTALDIGDARWNAKRKCVEGLARSLREPGRVLIPRYESAS